MSTIQFDIPTIFPAAALDGQINTVDVVDPDGSPNQVLDKGLPFSVVVTWQNTGFFVPFMGGEYTVRAYVESVGPGAEREIGEATVPVNASGLYSASISVPAGTLQPAEPELPHNPGALKPSGVYKLVVVVSYSNFGINLPIAGFSEEKLLFEIRNP